MTDLSVIIVCFKGWERLYKCLEALNAFTGEQLITEVIVVDNKSDEKTIFEIEKRFPKFRFIYNVINGGFSNGSNIGADNSSGEFLLFLNPDTVASESEINRLLNFAKKEKEFALVSCRQVNEKGKESIASGEFPSILNLTGLQRAIFKRRHSEFINSKSEISFPDWVSGSVIMISSDTFKKIGGFDEDFWMYYEDVNLCRRIREMDGRIAVCNSITIQHNHGGSSRVNIKTTALTKTEVHISRHVYISKNMKGMVKFIIQMFLVLNNLVSGGIMAIFGLVLFFIPKIFSRTLGYMRLIIYYTGSLFRLSWISPRSVNFKKH